MVRSNLKREQCKVLVVDDDPAQRQLLQRPLEQAGYDVITASTSSECLSKIVSEQPDLVLLDVMLGEEDGIELGREIKADERYRDLYLLFVSGSKFSAGDQAVGLEIGAEGYLTRPVDSRELVARVDSLARIRSAEKELRNSEALWRTMFAASNDLIIVCDDHGIILHANPRAEQFYAPRKSDLPGASIFDLLLKVEHAPMRLRMEEALSGKPQLFEAEHIREGKRAALVEVSLSSFRFQERQHLISVIRDLHARIEHEKERLLLMHEIMYERERLTNIISSVPGVVWEAWGGPGGTEHRLNYVSEYVEYMLGYSITEWLSDPGFALAITHPDDRDRVRQELAVSYTSADPGRQLETQCRWKKKNGNYIWVESLSRVVLDQQSNAVGMRGVTLDITRRKEAEENLRYQVEYNQAITQSMVEGVVVYDDRCRVVYMNGAAEDLLGFTADELYGKDLHEMTHAQSATGHHAAEDCLLRVPLTEHRAIRNLEEVFNRKDGSEFPALCSTAPLNSRAFGSGGVLVFRDINDLKQKESEIRQLNVDLERRVRERTEQLQETNDQLELTNEQLEAINKELEAFSYSVSHDLRAPFRHIVGFSELLEKRVGGELDETASKYLKTIARSAAYAGTLVDDLLNFSHIGRTELRQSQVDLGQLVEEIRIGLMQTHRDRTIDWKIDPHLPTVTGDVALLRIAFENLLSNAVKYTRKTAQPCIEIGVQERSDDHCVVFVRDNGVGFDMKYVGKLFGVFQRLHRSEEFEGTGIGLANVARIIQRHGGRVWAEGAVEKGATFFLRLPVSGS